MSSNRRRHTRVRARGVAAHLRTESGRTACQVENVSMGGLFVRTDRLEEVGAEIFVDLVKPGWKRQLTLTARVTSRVDSLDGRLSRRMPGMGIQFLRLDEKQHDRLRTLLRELGAPDEDLEVTLPDESAEEELRALELRSLDLDAASGESTEPLDPQPQPLWQQVQMAKEEASSVRRHQAREAAKAWEAPQSLVDDIEGALRDANFAPPGPVVLAPAPVAPAPAPPQRAAPPAKPAPPPSPLRVALPSPAAAPEAARAPDLSADNARLMLQIRGLVMQLSETQQQLSRREQEIERLKGDLDTLRSALARSVRNG